MNVFVSHFLHLYTLQLYPFIPLSPTVVYRFVPEIMKYIIFPVFFRRSFLSHLFQLILIANECIYITFTTSAHPSNISIYTTVTHCSVPLRWGWPCLNTCRSPVHVWFGRNVTAYLKVISSYLQHIAFSFWWAWWLKVAIFAKMYTLSHQARRILNGTCCK